MASQDVQSLDQQAREWTRKGIVVMGAAKKISIVFGAILR